MFEHDPAPVAEASPAPNPPSTSRRRKSSAAKLIQAAALAGTLVPLASVAADASPISCTFFSGGGGTTCSTGPQGGAVYNFGAYAAELRFDEVFNTFTVEITDVEHTYEEIAARFTDFFPNYQPVPIGTNPAAPYIDFVVTDPPEEGIDFRSEGARGPDADFGYDLWLYWLADTAAAYPNPEMLHDTEGTDDQFDFNMTIPGSYFDDPVPCGVFSSCEPPGCDVEICFASSSAFADPGVGGRDNMFTSFTLGDASAVPEPASMILLGTGLGSLFYRRRRNK
jgi:hypothetical protein